MIQTDPYTPEEGLYECVDCNWREGGPEQYRVCPNCGSPARNIAVPRE